MEIKTSVKRFKHLKHVFVMIAFVLLITTSLVILPVSAVPIPSLNVDVTGNSYNQNEPHIAINPTDSNKLVVGYNDYRNKKDYWLYYPQVGWSYSDNGGATWSFGADVSLASYHYTGDPVVAFESGGNNAYLAGMAWNDQTDGSIWIAKSTNGGHSFGTPTIIAAGSAGNYYFDKPWLSINPANNHIYMAWVKRIPDNANPTSMTIWFTRSIDGGATFSSPVQVGSDLNTITYPKSHGPQIAVGSGGKVYVSWHTSEKGISPSDSTWQPPRIFISESIDDGVTFGSSNLVAIKQNSLPAIFISMGADPSSGRIYIAYAERPTYPGDLDIYVATSTSAVGPWTIKRVNDDSVGNGKVQMWPSLSVAPNGRVDVIWYDFRDPSGKLNLYYSASKDEGATWEANTKVTDIVPGFTPTSLFAGDYNTVVSTNEKAVAVWMDNRLGDPEIYTSNLMMPTNLPPGAGIATPNSGGTIPSVYYGNPTTFTYDSPCATNVQISILLNDGLTPNPITGSMTEGPTGHWVYTITFLPRHGAATVSYTFGGCSITEVEYPIWIDPAGYIYDASIGHDARIAGATVTLQRPDGVGGWEAVPVIDPPFNLMMPNENPLYSDANGQYAWLVPDGQPKPYRVHVTAPGYLPAVSNVVMVPPPVFDLNVGLMPLSITDNIKPSIDSVVVYPAITIAGSNIEIKVSASDNVGVTQVIADGNLMEFIGGFWTTSITADSSLGSHTINIIAKDAANNEATTGVDYTVVSPQGGIGLAILQTNPKVSAGSSVDIIVRVTNTENFDDNFDVTMKTYASKPMDLTWSSWSPANLQTVAIKAKSSIDIPMTLNVPPGTAAGSKLYTIAAASKTWITKASKVGGITII